MNIDSELERHMRTLSAFAETVKRAEGQSPLYYAINRAWHQLFEERKSRAVLPLQDRGQP